MGKYNFGHELKNGAKVIVHEGDIVLCSTGGRSLEFVTWQIDEDGNCYLGHYFADFFEAVDDYRQRTLLGDD